jgi:hypothetical protein
MPALRHVYITNINDKQHLYVFVPDSKLNEA